MNKNFGNATYIIILVLFIIIFFTIHTSRMSYIKKKRIGMEGEIKTNGILKNFAKKNGCKLMTNVFLPLYDGTCEIDHILFGKFGIAVIETKNLSGKLSGEGKQLMHQIGTKKYYIYNPKLQNETHVKNIQHHLNKAGYQNVPIYSFVVFTNEELIFPLDIGIPLSKLEKNLSELPNKKCKYKDYYKAIKKAKVVDPLQKLRHNLEINRSKQIDK